MVRTVWDRCSGKNEKNRLVNGSLRDFGYKICNLIISYRNPESKIFPEWEGLFPTLIRILDLEDNRWNEQETLHKNDLQDP